MLPLCSCSKLVYGMLCPNCDKKISGTIKYRESKRQRYMPGRALEFCPECGVQCVRVEKTPERVTRIIFFLLILGAIFVGRPYGYYFLGVAVIVTVWLYRIRRLPKYVPGDKRYSAVAGKIVTG